MKQIDRNNENIKLNHFRSYSDFSYDVGEIFSVSISESVDGYTEFSVSNGKDEKCVMIIKQAPLRVFRDISPDDFMECFHCRLLDYYKHSACESFDSLELLLINKCCYEKYKH